MGSPLAAALAATLHPDTQAAAETQLKAYSASNFPEYLESLSTELAAETNAIPVRQAAGLALKNAISTRSQHVTTAIAQLWLNVDSDTRNRIKGNIVILFAESDRRVRYVAAQIVQAIAAIELPRNVWPTLIDDLLASTDSTANVNLMISTLECLGLICEVVHPSYLAQHSDKILTSVVAKIAVSPEAVPDVRIAALRALKNALVFIGKHFEIDTDRGIILEQLCTAACDTNEEIKVNALECINSIIELYYLYLENFVGSADVTNLVFNCMRSDADDVVMQAIEFWSTVAEVETQLNSEVEQYGGGNPQDIKHFHFVAKNLPSLINALWWLMTEKKDEDEDEDEWTISAAAANCMTLLALTAGNDIVHPVMTLVVQNIENSDWRVRDASLMAFGAIISGPEEQALATIVQQAMPSLLHLLQDNVNQVRESSAWVLGRICESLPSLITEHDLNTLLTALNQGLKDPSTRVASCCAWCVMNLIQIFGYDENAETSPLSNIFADLLQSLDSIARSRPNDPNFRSSIYEVIAKLISVCPNDKLFVIDSYAAAVLSNMRSVLYSTDQLVTAEDYQDRAEYLSSQCYVLSELIRRCDSRIDAKTATVIMEVMCLIVNSPSSSSTTVLNDVLLTTESLVNALGHNFEEYATVAVQWINAALAKYEDHQMCLIAIGLVGALARALEKDFAPYCPVVMELLVQDLQNDEVQDSVKPAIVSAFGDMALAIGTDFEQYLPKVIEVMQHAYNTFGQFATEDPHDEIVAGILVAIAETYVQIVQGFSASNRQDILEQHINSILGFVKFISQSKELTPEVFITTVGLIGDLAQTLKKGQHRDFFNNKDVNDMLVSALEAFPEERKTVEWALHEVDLQKRAY